MNLSAAYIAGFFDGEGCVSSHEYYHVGKYEKHPRVKLQICISNTNRELLELIQAEYGGLICQHTRKIITDHAVCFSWKVVGKYPMKKFLEDILPFLVIKKGDAILGLQFIETLREENLGCHPLSEEIHKLRREIHQKLRKRKSLKCHKLRAGVL